LVVCHFWSIFLAKKKSRKGEKTSKREILSEHIKTILLQHATTEDREREREVHSEKERRRRRGQTRSLLRFFCAAY